MAQDDNIPGMNLDKKYSKTPEILDVNSSKLKTEMEKTKKELEKIKNFIIKKYPFTEAIGVLPPQAVTRFIKEEEVPKETEKYVCFYVLILRRCRYAT